ncbi:hypothetical protein CAEBREN_10109 [Caenorhabditis brenneri]|uniref:Uncharacterized protein n=1 Tax=Caenorhabditis brenneri TaxID=135651 RepID=G0MGD3_CAEBE|nr:hypothetical protein CAEBREN_10109 [Caenorhabditis brenneri]
MDDAINQELGAIEIADDSQNNGLVSFLNQSLTLDTAEKASEVVKTIQATQSMKALELRGNKLGIEAGKEIAKALETHPELERCLWSDLFAGRLEHEIPPILEALGRGMIKAGAKIKELDLSDNSFGPIGANALKEFLESPSAFSLEVLKLNNNGLGVGGKQIAESLTECLRKSIAVGGESRLRLKTFIAGRNRLESPGVYALAATFKSLETVEWLDVRENDITDRGIRAIVDALKYNRNLRHLWLEENGMLLESVKELAKTLESWPKLEVLNLSYCLIDEVGCNYLVDHLNPQLHRHLKHVYLCHNDLAAPVAKSLIQKWAKFDGFTPKPVLHIHGNIFGRKFREVAQMAPENVNVGEYDDDLGSLDGDEFKRKSSDSNDADAYETADDVDDNEEQEEKIQIMPAGVAEDMKRAMDPMDQIDQLGSDFEERFQEDASRVILQLSAPLKLCEMNEKAMERAVEVVENIVKRAEAFSRGPFPASTRIIVNLFSQCSEEPGGDWGYNADPKVIGRLLTELLARGHFQQERGLIEKFFVEDIKAKDIKCAMDQIDQLDSDFETRLQEEASRVILQLSEPLKLCGLNEKAMERALEVADKFIVGILEEGRENIIKRAETASRNRFPVTTRILAILIMQCSGKTSDNWGYDVDPKVIGRILSELLARGHFQDFHENPDLIQNNFPLE